MGDQGLFLAGNSTFLLDSVLFRKMSSAGTTLMKDTDEVDIKTIKKELKIKCFG